MDPFDQFSYRRRGKLAPYWLAAIYNEKSFKKYYNSNAIKKMNIIQTCEKIAQMTLYNNKSARLNLYQSSQLMYGVAKIHLYQIAYHHNEVFEALQKLNATFQKDKSKNIDTFAFESSLIEVPRLDRSFQYTRLEKDLHLLSDEDFDDRFQINHDYMQNVTLNFGCLNDEGLEILEHDSNFLLLVLNSYIFFVVNGPRIMQISEDKDISKKMADITIADEIHRERIPSQEILTPVLVDISNRKDKPRNQLTPQKRLQHQIQEKTPTKKRRLTFDTVPPVPIEDVAVLSPELPKENMETLAFSEKIELRPLYSDDSEIVKRPKKLIIDQRISLTDKQLKKWRQNVQFRCRQYIDTPQINRPIPAENLFMQPSHLPKRWNANLKRNPFADSISNVADKLMQSHEVIRIETDTRRNLTEDLSALGKTNTIIATEPTVDSIANIIPTINIIHEIEQTSMVPKMVPEMLPDTMTVEENTSIVDRRTGQKITSKNDTVESFEDIEILLKKQQSQSIHLSQSSTTSIETSRPPLTSQEILALLEVLWCDKPYVKFSELIPKETYTKDDAATAFDILLQLHAQKKIVLQQKECYRTLWISKYSDS
ncbi:hypothetical protein P5V15_004433 [Pogonomyrmex californicus]